MSLDRFEKPPYLDWTLDRWKIGLILLVFGGLLVSSLIGPVDEAASAALPSGAVRATLPVTMRPSSVDPVQPAAQPTAQATAVPPPTPAPGTPVPTAAPPTAVPATPPPTSVALPLTLANLSPNAVVPAGAVRALFGTARGHSIVEVRDQVVPAVAATDLSPGVAQELVLGMAAADADGLWQLGPFDPLGPGQHVLSLFQLDDQGKIEAASSPVVVTVLASGEQGPLSLATPTLRFPAVGSRVRPGAVTFVGAGLPGMMVRLYLNNRMAGEGLVSAREEFRLTPAEALAPGVVEARVAAVNPQGEIIAESAPVVFVVEEEPQDAPQGRRSGSPLPTPSLPLTISSLAFGDRRRQSLVVRGLATPHAGVSAWLDERPLKFVNVQTDGGWQFWLFAETELAHNTEVEIRTSLGERLRAKAASPAAALAPSAPPVLLAPKPGDVLTTRRPLVMGLAQPSIEVTVMVNRRQVGRVLADRQGLWSYRLVDPLPAGYTALAARIEGTWTTPDLESSTVVVTVAPRL
jgi:hypothetical protein